MSTNTFDLIIIGAGPGGYEMAAEAAHQQLKVAVVERDELGGTCLNRGCIPTKALCRNAEVINTLRNAAEFGVSTAEIKFDYAEAFKRKQSVVEQLRQGIDLLLSGADVTVIKGEATLTGQDTVSVNGDTYSAKNIVIATGSAPKALPITGADLCMSSDDALALDTLPSSLCIIGGGVIGMEFASVFNAFGVDVTVIEFCKEILPPFDKDIAKRLRSLLSRQGVKIITSAAVKSVSEASDGSLCVTYDTKGKVCSTTCQKALMAVGRRPVVPSGAEQLGIEVTPRGIVTDADMRTSISGIFAIGDVNGKCMLAHAASAQGFHVLNCILGKKSNINLNIVPSAVFTTPELAMVGLTEAQCSEQGLDFATAKALFRANGKALAMGETDGLIKMIVDKSSRKILGCHICGAHASDLIQSVVVVMNADATVDLIADSIHTHPTLSEVVQSVARMF